MLNTAIKKSYNPKDWNLYEFIPSQLTWTIQPYYHLSLVSSFSQSYNFYLYFLPYPQTSQHSPNRMLVVCDSCSNCLNLATQSLSFLVF